MLVSHVETGLRFAIVTMVCAARCMTVAISYSPRARSSITWSRTSPRTIFTFSIKLVRASSLCGIQSRTRQTTSARASTRRRTSQPPTSPVAPVTNVGLSRQKELIPALPPDLPRGLAAVPELVEHLVLAVRVHGEEEALVAVDHLLPL